MQKNKFVVLVLGLLLCEIAWGQLSDTIISLQEIQVTAAKHQYLVGSKIETVDSARLNSVSGESLTEILTRYLPIYVKQDAGGLATIRFRGTSPDHTAILFNGININSLTLGHSNISNIPMFLFDDVKVQYGSSSSLYGTDAIGGSIHLGNNPEWNKGFGIGLQQDIGSFGSYFSGLKLSYSNRIVQYSVKLYHQKKEEASEYVENCIDLGGASRLTPTSLLKTQINEYINKEDWERVIKLYGKPTGVISDMQPAFIELVKELLPGVPHQYCQYHFLNNAGELMEDDYRELGKRIKQKEVSAKVERIENEIEKSV